VPSAALFHTTRRRFSALGAIHGDVASAHLHLINPQPEAFEPVEEAVRLQRWADLTLSSEVYDSLDQRAYYSSARMVLAPMLLKLYDFPMLISAIDAV
jgi:hypothetical protein